MDTSEGCFIEEQQIERYAQELAFWNRHEFPDEYDDWEPAFYGIVDDWDTIAIELAKSFIKECMTCNVRQKIEDLGLVEKVQQCMTHLGLHVQTICKAK